MKWQLMAQTNVYSSIYKIVEKIETMEPTSLNVIRIVIFIATTILMIIAIYQYFSTMMEYKKFNRREFEDESRTQFLKERGKKECRRMVVMIVIWTFLNSIWHFL